MRHPAHPSDPGPRRRPEPTHPIRGARHGTGRAAPTRPGTRRDRHRPSAAISGPATPATVWTCGPAPIDPDALWPTPIVRTIVTSFTEPGARVVLLTAPPPAGSAAPGPHTAPENSPLAPTGPHSPTASTAPPPDPNPADTIHTAHAVIAHLRRDPRLMQLPPDTTRHDRADEDSSRTDPLAAAARHDDTEAVTEPHSGVPRVDLVIASVRPEHTAPRTAEHLARVAARLLRTSGILAVLTHSDRVGGRLRDPTGTLVTAAQNHDLLYLQHIVVLHTPIRDSHLDTTALTTDQNPARADSAAPPELPGPHHRAHRDLVILAQSNERHPGHCAALPAGTRR